MQRLIRLRQARRRPSAARGPVLIAAVLAAIGTADADAYAGRPDAAISAQSAPEAGITGQPGDPVRSVGSADTAAARATRGQSSGPTNVGGETELDRRTRDLASQLRCPVCQGLSIQDSPSEMAQDMRALVREQLAAGSTPDDVKAYFVQGYGEWVLLEPRAEGFNLTVYLLPIAALLAGAAFVVLLTRRWTRAAGAVPAPGTEDDPDLAPWDEQTAAR